MHSDPWLPAEPLLNPAQRAARARLTAALKDWTADLTGTLVFVTEQRHVLLIKKKTGHGAGLLNGPGGKLEPGEGPLACAQRELKEELCVSARHLQRAAQLRFVDLHGPQWLGHVYVGHGLEGIPSETREAQPVWYPDDALPFAQMWPDDRIWLPLVLAGHRLHGDFLLDGERLLAHRWRRVADLGPDP